MEGGRRLEQVTNEDKATIFRKEFDELMRNHNFIDDPNAITLRDKVVEWLRFSSGGDLVVSGFKAGVGKMVSEVFQNKLLQEKVDQLILKVATLEATAARVGKLEQENNILRERLTSLEDDKAEKALNITISDLGRMYAKYVIVPLLPKFLGSALPTNKLWGEFCEQYRNKEDDVDEGHLTPTDFDKWIDPLVSQLGIDLKLLMTRIKLRNLNSHCDIRSVPKQKSFLASIPLIKVEGDCGNLLVNMFKALQDPGIKMTRMK